MADNNQPPREVLMAYGRKCERLSMEVEKIARLAVHWLDKETTKELWLAQTVLYQLAKRLKDN